MKGASRCHVLESKKARCWWCWGHILPCNMEGGREREPWWKINKIRCDLIWARHRVTGWRSSGFAREETKKNEEYLECIYTKNMHIYAYNIYIILFINIIYMQYTYVHNLFARVMEWVIWPHEELSGILERTSVFAIHYFIHLFMTDSRIQIHTSNTFHSNQANPQWASKPITLTCHKDFPHLMHYSIIALDSQDGRIIDSESQSGKFVTNW